MHDVYQKVLDDGLAFHKAEEYDKAEVCYQRVLNRMPFEESILFLLADLYLRKEYNGLAVNLLSNLLQNNPKNAKAWNNLGIAFRKENNYDFAKAAYKKSIELDGDTEETCSNVAGLYADRAQPQKALEWLDRALVLNPENPDALWQKALALLSLRNWDEGWKHYANRQRLQKWDSRKSIEVPIWDGSPVKHLYIHGEQGIGDEVMFCSMLHKITFSKAANVTLEVNAKLKRIAELTWPDFNVVTTETKGDYDAKLPMGSLFGMYGFNGKPYLEPDPARVDFYRSELAKLGDGPYIALAWIGGTKVTGAEDRSMSLGDLAPIREFTCVSGQYYDTNPYIEPDREKYGIPVITPESTGLDLAEQAALFKAVDAVVTVQQTAVHVAGAVGARCYAMISPTPPWRYGIEGSSMPFYESVTLFRRAPDEQWAAVVSRVKEQLDADFSELRRAESRAA